MRITSRRLNLPVCLVLLLSCGCSEMFRGESEYQQARNKEEGFIRLVLDSGGLAVKEGRELHGMTGVGWFINLEGAQITPELIDELVDAAQKDPVFELNFANSSITDDQLLALDQGKVLQKVVVLDLSNTAITDAGLDGMKNHYIISELKLSGSQAGKAAAERLGARQIASPQTPEPFKKQPELDL